MSLDITGDATRRVASPRCGAGVPARPRGPPGDLVAGHAMSERLDGVVDVVGAEDGGEAHDVPDQSGGELAQ